MPTVDTRPAASPPATGAPLTGVPVAEAPLPSISIADVNAHAVNRWNAEGWEWGRPISHETFEQARRGTWSVLLTPTKPVPRTWFPANLTGLRVLGLASGGGQQMPIFAALGCRCTVLDYAPSQLEAERMVAEREGYDIEVVRADMARPLPFADKAFDLVFHPIANCYIREVLPLWRECYRVLAPGGRLLAGLDNGFNYVVDNDEERVVNALPFDPLAHPDQRAQLEADDSGLQFSHTFEEQIRGQLQAGLRLVDCYEDTNGRGRLHELRIPSYWATCAEKPRG